VEPGDSDVLEFLDDLQAAEHAGAATLERWIAVCADPLLRGGLRVLRARDEAHAALALARLRELGGQPRQGVSPGLDALCSALGSDGVSDRAKLGMLLARFPRKASDPFAAVACPADGDDETRALLEAVSREDRLSVEWLRMVEDAPPVVPRERIGADERDSVVAFLGALAAATDAAADVAETWTAACRSDGLRGGLRALTQRTAAHAAVLRGRLRELGGTPGRVTLSASLLAAARDRYGSTTIGDHEKLASMLHPADHDTTPVRMIEAFAASLAEDVETREILRLVAAGDKTTMVWLTAYRATA
jgi:hypothetical protein